MLKFKVKKGESGKRADIIVANRLPQYTRSSLKQLFTKSFVSRSGSAIKASSRLQSGQEIKVDNTLLEQLPKQIEIPIIYENDNVIVINKPAGILTHSKGALNTEATVATWLLDYLKKANYNIKPSFSGCHPGNRFGIVHRLDRQTSGVMICAKNDKTLKWLQKQFSTRKVKKIYQAVVQGIPEPAEAIIDAPIERNPKKPQTFRVGRGGKPAQTKYKVLKRFELPAPHQNLSGVVGNQIMKHQVLVSGLSNLALVELRPLTGRTHQLRVHMKYIGHPIVGDKVYGHGGRQMYLHAKSLEINLPDGKTSKFEAPEPKYFRNPLEQ